MTNEEADSSDAAHEQLLRIAAKQSPVPELYFASVRAIGTPVGPVQEILETSLARVGYYLGVVKLSEALDQDPYTTAAHLRPADKESVYNRHRRLSEAAIVLRRRTEQRDAVAKAAIESLRSKCREAIKTKAEASSTKRGVAFLFRNLMHHEEVTRLRHLYDRQFFLLSIYSDLGSRLENLQEKIQREDSVSEVDSRRFAESLIHREENFFRRSQEYDPEVARYRKIVTNIPKTFQYGDLFLDNRDPDLAVQVNRFVELIFGYPFHTPTRDEIGMSHAFSAALQSGNLARQVGAAICAEDGDLLSIGTNDVAKPMGGVYRFDDAPDDYRDYNLSPRLTDYARGQDSSDTIRRDIFTDLVRRLLADPAWLDELATMSDGRYPAAADLARELARYRPGDVSGLIDTLLGSDLIWGAQLFDSLEYSRALHAEMDAITSAARKGISIAGATLYCTTLPCHECARLIIGSGIRRVIFIEPYEKSRVQELYSSEVRFTNLADSRASESKDRQVVDFVPYVGVSPRRFGELFAKSHRKLEDQPEQARLLSGLRAAWEPADAEVREAIVSPSALASSRRLADVLDHEDHLIADLRRELEG